MQEKKYKFIPVSEETHKLLLTEKHKRSMEKGKTLTFDSLVLELVTKK